jgi:hypothetical protein
MEFDCSNLRMVARHEEADEFVSPGLIIGWQMVEDHLGPKGALDYNPAGPKMQYDGIESPVAVFIKAADLVVSRGVHWILLHGCKSRSFKGGRTVGPLKEMAAHAPLRGFLVLTS